MDRLLPTEDLWFFLSTGKGEEPAVWQGRGIGRPKGTRFAAGWRGSLPYQTSSPEWARLNSIAVVFEYNIDENGNYRGKIWEWK